MRSNNNEQCSYKQDASNHTKLTKKHAGSDSYFQVGGNVMEAGSDLGTEGAPARIHRGSVVLDIHAGF